MKLKIKKMKTYKLEVTKGELVAIELAISLMLQDENTNQRWMDTLIPVVEEILEALGQDPDDWQL